MFQTSHLLFPSGRPWHGTSSNTTHHAQGEDGESDEDDDGEAPASARPAAVKFKTTKTLSFSNQITGHTATQYIQVMICPLTCAPCGALQGILQNQTEKSQLINAFASYTEPAIDGRMWATVQLVLETCLQSSKPVHKVPHRLLASTCAWENA